MKILAMDTATKSATVAVIEDGCLVGEFTLNSDRPHSQKIMPLTEDLLKEIGIKSEDIDVFAFAKGPGSFTGLRIGAAAVQGFAQATGKKAVGVSTLEAMAYSLTKVTDACVCPVIDAKREQVYYALYRMGDEIIAPSVESVENVIAQVSCLNKKVIFVGDGVEAYPEKFENAFQGAATAPGIFNVNMAVNVALLAYEKEISGEGENPFPDYMMKSYVDKE